MPDDPHQPGQLKRQIGLFHAVLLGLGSILGTGVFVSIGIAAGIAGPAVLIAIVLAALLALCNGLSSAQLAAAHPVAGGTYEYGYKYLHPKLGFTAGWMFLLAKSASAATAALGVTVYMLEIYSWYMPPRPDAVATYDGFGQASVLLSLGVVAALVILVLFGVRRSAKFNLILVVFTLTGLIGFVIFVVIMAPKLPIYHRTVSTSPYMSNGLIGVLSGTSLMFVAFTGYGRIATLGEEVRHPKRTIPLSIMVTLAVSTGLYLAVGYALLLAEDSGFGFSTHKYSYGQQISVLLTALDPFVRSLQMHHLIAIAAITAMLGVLLNLILGLSRVALAMGRRRDLPGLFARVNESGTTPVPAVIGVGILIASLTLIGDVKTTWSFAAFTVLIYYGITNLAALRLPKENRLYPRVFAWAGLGGCLFLCWWVDPIIWAIGCGLIVLGLIWHTLTPRMFGDPPLPTQRCVTCGYDLRASTGTCPECGEPIPDAIENA